MKNGYTSNFYPEVVGTDRNRVDARAIIDFERKLLKPGESKNIIPMPGYIRSDVELDGPVSSVEFHVREGRANRGANAQLPVENRLKDNDAFYVQDIGVFFRTIDPANTPNLFPTPPVNPSLRSFGNNAAITANGALIDQAQQGKLSARVDSTVFIDAMPGTAFRFVGDAQEGAGPAVVTPADSWDLPKGQHPVTPMLRMNGYGNNEFIYDFPEAIEFATVDPLQAIVLFATGFYVQNAGYARSKA